MTLCILAITITGITACSQTPDCFRRDIFCAGLVTDTRGVADLGLNQNAWVGLEQSQSDGVVDQIAYIESVNVKDYEKNIAYFVDSGYDVIVTSGNGLREATYRYAELHPDSVFIGINQPKDNSAANFISVTFPEDQMGFFAGALAVRLTQSGSIGAVCETSGIPEARRDGARQHRAHLEVHAELSLQSRAVSRAATTRRSRQRRFPVPPGRDQGTRKDPVPRPSAGLRWL